MVELGHHGDAEVGPGLIDLAVNVRQAPLPPWLLDPVAASLADLASYPDPAPARAALAARHGRDPSSILLTAGAAQAFVLIAQAYRAAALPVVVHPQFTEPEAALLAAGHRVHRVCLPPPYALDPSLVPAAADLVFVGNPTNPTSVLHPVSALSALARPGRILVVDEAFADTTLGPTGSAEPSSLSRLADIPGLIVLRSLTKTWALAGLRIGYALAAPDVIRRLSEVQPLWPVSTPALAAAVACASPEAVAAEHAIAHSLAADRAHLLSRLAEIPSVSVAAAPESSFVLLKMPNADKIRLALRDRGYAVRRGDTFPGLGPDFLRVAVRDRTTSDAFTETLSAVVPDFLP
ncbi:histidinol-phosphate aminotransferase [Asanoa ferruginea]|uniref:Aminotransferase n=1 Tax=Asanoa ferruginea TaxID=53367 RepID=A0A3D9ZAX4_9ACTN|nr:Rv2231c family pyridoxal phosphate-dependent protein CobC [Asanoa ferruginea]REF94417.1 histidinol-phosphate aminotransferase [Asanoa ferruginea]GIF53460.1 aminotransferase [Asanoa ferruginea]